MRLVLELIALWVSVAIFIGWALGRIAHGLKQQPAPIPPEDGGVEVITGEDIE